MPSTPVTGVFWQTTQPVSGTFFQATQPVSIAAMPSTPVTGTFWPVTQPVSLAALPALTTGAAAIGTVGVTSLPALTTGANVIGAVTQSGTWNVGAITTLPALAAGANIIGKVGIDQTTANTTNLVSLGATPAAIADAAAIPTTAKVGAINLLYNGATLDLARGNTNVSIAGDAGTKTVTFNGAAQTNFNARGAIITVVLGAVSGTAPTLSVQLSISIDGGVAWLTLGPAMTALNGSSQVATLLVYPANMSQAAGATPANIVSGASQTQALNLPLPRTWRLVYTIGGTTPSFVISQVAVNYIL
jgi:hypothetical protein